LLFSKCPVKVVRHRIGISCCGELWKRVHWPFDGIENHGVRVGTAKLTIPVLEIPDGRADQLRVNNHRA
jgi:hypothetical protein